MQLQAYSHLQHMQELHQAFQNMFHLEIQGRISYELLQRMTFSFQINCYLPNHRQMIKSATTKINFKTLKNLTHDNRFVSLQTMTGQPVLQPHSQYDYESFGCSLFSDISHFVYQTIDKIQLKNIILYCSIYMLNKT